MSIKKPTYTAPKTADLKKGLERLEEYVKDVKRGDGKLDMSDLEEKVSRSRTDHVKAAFEVVKDSFTKTVNRTSHSCGGSTTVRVEVPKDRLNKTEVKSLMDALIDARSTVDKLDKDKSGALEEGEVSGRGRKLAGKLGRASAKLEAKMFQNELEAWADAIQTAVETVDERGLLSEEIDYHAGYHAETPEGEEALKWAFRNIATRFPDDFDVWDIGTMLDDAETGMLRAAPFFHEMDTGPGHLSDAEIKSFLGTDDLKGHAQKCESEVDSRVGKFDDWLEGKDLAHHDQIDEYRADNPSPSGC